MNEYINGEQLDTLVDIKQEMIIDRLLPIVR